MADTRQKWVSLRSKCRLVKRQNMQCCIVQISPTRLAAIKLRVDLVGIVKQGFKEDKVAMDGPDFNYYAHVCELQSVRASVLQHK